MSTPIEVKLVQAAAANSGLSGLLGSAPFRWYDTQLAQGSAFPAVAAQVISATKLYVFEGRPSLSRYRVQFTIWGGQNAGGRDAADQTRDALFAFLDSFSATAPGQYPNQVVMDRRALYFQADPPIFQRVIDAMIYSDDSK